MLGLKPKLLFPGSDGFPRGNDCLPQQGGAAEAAAMPDDGGLGGGDGLAGGVVVGGGEGAVGEQAVGEGDEVGEVVAFAQPGAEPVDAGIELAGRAALGGGDEFALIAEAFHRLAPVVPQLGIEAAGGLPGVAAGAVEATAQLVANGATQGVGMGGVEGLPGGDLGDPGLADLVEQGVVAAGGLDGEVVSLDQGRDDVVEGHGEASVGLSGGEMLGEAGEHGEVAGAGQFAGQFGQRGAPGPGDRTTSMIGHETPGGAEALGGDAIFVDHGLVGERRGIGEPVEAGPGHVGGELSQGEVGAWGGFGRLHGLILGPRTGRRPPRDAAALARWMDRGPGRRDR